MNDLDFLFKNMVRVRARAFSIIFMTAFYLPMVLFVGCLKKVKSSRKPLLNSPHVFEILEAKNSDIPIPVGYKPIFASPDDNEKGSALTVMRYEGMQSLSMLKNFYISGMERNGWHIVDFSVHDEILFVCNKQGRSCAISVRPLEKNKNSIVIFIKIGKDNASMMSNTMSKHVGDATGEIELFEAR